MGTIPEAILRSSDIICLDIDLDVDIDNIDNININQWKIEKYVREQASTAMPNML